MKKITAILVMMLFFLLGLIQTETGVKADGNYDINKYLVNVKVHKDGNAEVTQKITYKFDGDFHGVYFNQDLKGIKGVKDPSVSIKDKEGTNSLSESNSEMDNTFNVNKNSDKMKIKVYHNISDSSATFIYRYKLFGVITNYKDTAALNWKVIGSGWDEPLNNVKISIQLPEQNISQLQAWSHGPLNGYTDVDKQSGTVTLSVDYVNANQFVESHIIFPTSVTASNTNIVNKDAKSSILKQEKKLAENANEQRKMPKRIFYIVLAIFIFIVVLIYAFIYRSLKKDPIQKHAMPTPLNHWFEIPEVSPSMAQIILEKKETASSSGLTGDLLVEVNNHNLEITKKDNTFEIKAIKMPKDRMFQYLINSIGNGKSVTIKQINDSSSSKLFGKYESWTRRAAKGRKAYFDFNNMSKLKTFLVAAVATTILSFIMGIVGIINYVQGLPLVALVMLIALIVAWGSYVYAKRNISVYTEKGEILANELRGFEQMLKDIEDINLAEVGDLILWEQILPYAVAFGVSEKVVKALKMHFREEVQTDPGFAYYYWGVAGLSGNMDFTSSITNSFSSSDTSNSSIGGSSGGFSGGSSGGFGGGSGGGAF
ncbi:DUF2207 domain-containing protein [Companilactobacillus keshanensis]|uniref:DUF2207 domain-containing protein n=1 Tax=Companilactobacillus keshanensis TaxID=2486003 RepID=A0ABW4BRU1_9LACO|nr:DUF2207 domain-containing protein [Companilactobacillus keshanensis]